MQRVATDDLADGALVPILDEAYASHFAKLSMDERLLGCISQTEFQQQPKLSIYTVGPVTNADRVAAPLSSPDAAAAAAPAAEDEVIPTVCGARPHLHLQNSRHYVPQVDERPVNEPLPPEERGLDGRLLQCAFSLEIPGAHFDLLEFMPPVEHLQQQNECTVMLLGYSGIAAVTIPHPCSARKPPADPEAPVLRQVVTVSGQRVDHTHRGCTFLRPIPRKGKGLPPRMCFLSVEREWQGAALHLLEIVDMSGSQVVVREHWSTNVRGAFAYSCKHNRLIFRPDERSITVASLEISPEDEGPVQLEALYSVSVADALPANPVVASRRTQCSMAISPFEPVAAFVDMHRNLLVFRVDGDDSLQRTFAIERPQASLDELQVGSIVDCVDTVNKTYEARVEAIQYGSGDTPNMIKVHYLGWSARWDEWVTFPNDRVTPRGTSSNTPYQPTSMERVCFPATSLILHAYGDGPPFVINWRTGEQVSMRFETPSQSLGQAHAHSLETNITAGRPIGREVCGVAVASAWDYGLDLIGTPPVRGLFAALDRVDHVAQIYSLPLLDPKVVEQVLLGLDDTASTLHTHFCSQTIFDPNMLQLIFGFLNGKCWGAE